VRSVWALSALCAAVGLGLSDCVRVPNADPVAAGPNIDQVVRRVKCDLVAAVKDKLHREHNTWLQTWVAQASLTFIVNDASTLTPGATLTQPLNIISEAGRISNFGQSANLGLGVGYNTTGSRNETVTFSLAFEELADHPLRDPEHCEYPNETDLKSELGLKGWIDAALTPAQRGHLVPGHHKSAKAGTTGATSSSSAAANPSLAPSAQYSATLGVAGAQFKNLDKILGELTTVGHTFKAPPGKHLTPDQTDAFEKRIAKLKGETTTLNTSINDEMVEINKREIDDPTTIVGTSVTAITPQRGSTLGGTHVMIIGADFDNFDKAKGATVGGRPLSDIQVQNDATLCGYTQRHPPTSDGTTSNPVDVVVNALVNGSPEAGTKTGAFNYVAPAPYDDKKTSVISIQPSTAVIADDATVTITGVDTPGKDKVDFKGATTVTFGEKAIEIDPPATTSDSLTVKVPQSLTPGLVDVVVKAGDKLLGGAKSVFTYNDGACPAQAASKKKIIAYVDPNLDKKIDAALFKSRKLIVKTEMALNLLDESDPDWSNYNTILQTTKSLQDALLTLEMDPPLDAVGHQVQFLITYTGSISPSWTLVNFKGPSPAMGTGFSATKTLTHTLNIAMGPPGSPDVANTLGALQLGTAIGNSLSTGATSITIQ
jgi:hypothetical protein